MKNNKVTAVCVIAGLVLLCIIMLLVNGISITIGGVFSFSTKYYKTPEEAFAHDGSQSIAISQSVEFIKIDDHNGMFIGITDEYETKAYICLSMQTKNEKYLWSGYYATIEYPSDSEEVSFEGDKIFLYNKRGGCEGQYEYFIIYDEDDLQRLDDSYAVKFVTSGQDNGFYFVYRII